MARARLSHRCIRGRAYSRACVRRKTSIFAIAITHTKLQLNGLERGRQSPRAKRGFVPFLSLNRLGFLETRRLGITAVKPRVSTGIAAHTPTFHANRFSNAASPTLW